MNLHLMLDFETLSTVPNAAVLSLGAVVFDREKFHEEKEWVFSLKEQVKTRAVDASTLCWWLNQTDAARSVFKRAEESNLSSRQFAGEFSSWLKPYRDPLVWSNGAGFDVPIAEHLLGRAEHPPVWKFWRIRCYRTLKTLFHIESVPRQGTAHDALQDAKYQAACVQGFLRANPDMDK